MATSYEPSDASAPPGAGPTTVARESPRLTLPEGPEQGRLQGVWWPRSRDLETELADLIVDLPARLGRVSRVACSRADWDGPPQQVEIGGSAVRVTPLTRGEPHVVVLTLSSRDLRLTVVPPETPESRAVEIMRAATSSANRAAANGALAPVLTDRGAPNEHWDDHGTSWWAPHPVPPSYRTGGGGADAHAPSALSAIDFQGEDGTYTGHSESGRSWRITRVLTGWHLEFHDQGDPAATNAGVHRSVEAAIAEANR